MSNSLLYDPLLVRYLAGELDALLRARACSATLTFPGERRAVLPLDAGQGLVLDLHPTRGWIHPTPWEAAEELDAVIEGVEAVPDERLLVIRMRVEDRFHAELRSVYIELHTNQWNALLVDETRRILSLTWTRSAGRRLLRSGDPYEPPPASPRYGSGEVEQAEASARWSEIIATAAPEHRGAALLKHFAYTGTPNLDFVLGSASTSAVPGDMQAAFQRWWWLRGLPPAKPVLLTVGRRIIPYPLPLSSRAVDQTASLLEGMSLLAQAGQDSAGHAEDAAVLARVAARRVGIQRRIQRLEQELAGAAEADALRARADVLLARLHQVPRGASTARLEGWDGDTVEIELDPALQPAENAARMYEEARRRDRARTRVEELLASSRQDLVRWDEAVAATASGELPEWVERELTRSSPDRGPAAPERVVPYRTYRTSGGLEARVGKSARGNDDLTFRHAAPNDVWLHARSIPGSHVILRWRDADAAPPGRDLREAAGLAALFSRARSSGLVAVDWTRRKHVRKPRGAPPGAVIPQRVKTVFVEPDEGLPDRLRED